MEKRKMRVVGGREDRDQKHFYQENDQALRKRLLALFHIAIKEHYKWTDDYYRNYLERKFGVCTASALTACQLQAFISAAMDCGWKPVRPFNEIPEQIDALRSRVQKMARQTPHGTETLKELCLSMCGVESVEWVKSPDKLQRLLRGLGNHYRHRTVAKQVAT